MKKILSLFAAFFMAVSMWGTTVTFNYADYKGNGTTSQGSAYTMDDKSYVSIGDDKFFGNNTQAHFYAGGTITVTPKGGATITKVAITSTSTSYNGYQSSGTYNPSVGSVAANSTNAAIVEWTGNATSSFTIGHTKQIRWTSIEVTYSTGDSGDQGGEDGGDQGGEDGGDPTPTPASQPTSVNFANLGYASWGKSASFSGSTYDEVEQTIDGVTFTYTRNSGSIYANTGSMRFYKANELTFDAPTGYKITSIEFTGSSFKNDVTTEDNLCISTTRALSWEGEAASVTFTRPSNADSYMTLSAVAVTLAPVVKIGTTHYATFYHSSHAYVMPEGLEGITVEGVEGSALTLNKTHYAAGSVVPAGEALILHGAAGNYTLLAGSTSNAKVAENLLKGTSTADEMTTGGDKYYRLSVHEGVVGFYYGAADGAAFKPGANKAYLAVSNTSAPAHFTFTDEVTAVENVEAVGTVKFMQNGQLFIKKNGVIYNAMGQVVK